ncbi:MAG TPA: AMP-binding protein, partial [Vicinamibacteria bacterium]|nr:AMP-binding protein [Vicinamibacteria bacterium]
VFRADNTRGLFRRFTGGSLVFEPEKIDWYRYWLDVHLPGLEKWVFPRLDESEKKVKRVYTYRSLVELFDAATKNHAGRVAMRMERGGREERYTYADFRECTLRAAAFLRSHGIEGGKRVALLSENCPEWGMAYFGIVRTGAGVIPLEKEITSDEIVRLLEMGEASAIVLSEELLSKHRSLAPRLDANGAQVRVWSFEDVFALTDEVTEQKRVASLPATVAPSTVASVIYTSGTTGKPKGVMLTHRNLVSLLAKLLSVFDIDHDDGMLSVLPLHHSFEFSAGFLLPLSRGATITYLAEVNGDNLSRALKKGQVTCIVGVPALWDLLKRRILGRFEERSESVADLLNALVDANYLLREEAPLNFGPLLFLPIHLAFGGRIRYLISGGSALRPSTLKTFRGLGFDLFEGYGLTEASPVLAVTRPDEKTVLGSVGKALPGIEIRIHDPDRRGVGEVIARGPNVMAGYYGNEESTREALRGGWLYTGDLGRIDDEGNLFIVGRSKEIIIDQNGKNVYPDELEELYRNADLIKEIAVLGFPDGVAERVAAVVVPNRERDGSGSDEIARRIDEHIQVVSGKLPLYKRIKIYELRDEELPKTATRKVKKRELLDWLREKRRAEERESFVAEADKEWLLEMVARIAEKPREAVTFESGLDELGFDSLMYNELAAAIESRTGDSLSPDVLMSLTGIRELAESVRRQGVDDVEARSRAKDKNLSGSEKVELPAILQQVGRKGLSAVQHWFYFDYLEPAIRGQANVPVHTHFLVVANHASHLDMGLVKMALGEAGKNLVALAAADYFFDNRVKRAFFENFTNLVPMERKGSLRKSLEWAFELLERGYNLLIFPEGTRSRTGELQSFQRGLGHLVLRARVGVLPLYLSTFRALPPGAWYPQSREVSASIGPFLTYERLERVAEGLPRSDAERAVTRLVQRIVERLRDGTPIDLETEISEARGNVSQERKTRQPVVVGETDEGR